VDQHFGDTEAIGDQARMRPPRPAEAIERVAGHVVAALDGDFLDRVGHVLDRDPDESVGDVLGRSPATDLSG